MAETLYFIKHVSDTNLAEYLKWNFKFLKYILFFFHCVILWDTVLVAFLRRRESQFNSRINIVDTLDLIPLSKSGLHWNENSMPTNWNFLLLYVDNQFHVRITTLYVADSGHERAFRKFLTRKSQSTQFIHTVHEVPHSLLQSFTFYYNMWILFKFSLLWYLRTDALTTFTFVWIEELVFPKKEKKKKKTLKNGNLCLFCL